MTSSDQRTQQEREAEQILRRAEQESHGVFTGAMQRLMQISGLTRGETAPAEDRIEVWARRIGRSLGAIAAILLVLNLFTGWFF